MRQHGGKLVLIRLLLPAICMISSSANTRGEENAQPPTQQQSAMADTPKKAPAAPAASAPRVEIERLKQPARQKKKKEKVGNAFGATSWYVPPPPPPPVKPPPPPPPSAPPMPFSFLGIYEGGGGKVILLVKGDHLYTVAVGDVIENNYRVDSVGNGVVGMTYLPLNIKQSINTGNSL